MKKVDWENSNSNVLCNPTYQANEKKLFYTILNASDHLPGHVWLSTSGSTSQKWVGLSKQAILSSASAVNQHLESDSTDRWIQALPNFHIGGLSIKARAYLSGAEVYCYQGKWDPQSFYLMLQEQQGTLTTLVPTQLYDLVNLNLNAPSHLRAVVIGGGSLSQELYQRAISLKWPILPSYGMTECASQVATASLMDLFKHELPEMKILSHLEVCEQNGCLAIGGTSLLSCYAFLKNEQVVFKDPKNEGWFLSEDRGIVSNRCLKIHGRIDTMVKIGGESVDVAKLETLWQTIVHTHANAPESVIIAIPNTRLGHVIHLAYVDDVDEKYLQELIEKYQQAVLPFEKIRKINHLPYLPRSPLGKILKKELLSMLQAE
ncbi:MAG: AMP-binding protein [Parachlamydiaceae bacterium]|nr:AMP-binding protein [Parachlamydiaceae bacterium]